MYIYIYYLHVRFVSLDSSLHFSRNFAGRNGLHLRLIGGHWEAALGELRGRQGRFGEIDGLGVSMNQLQWW